jgi:hypothetical protein
MLYVPIWRLIESSEGSDFSFNVQTLATSGRPRRSSAIDLQTAISKRERLAKCTANSP